MDIASQADLKQRQFTGAKFLLSTEHAWNKEGVAGSQKWLPYHLLEGYLGVNGVRRQRQNESNQTLGNSPRRWRRARAYINITHTLELKHKLSLSLAQHFLFETLHASIKPILHAFLSLFSRCTMLEYFFLFFEFDHLRRNLTYTFWYSSASRIEKACSIVIERS